MKTIHLITTSIFLTLSYQYANGQINYANNTISGSYSSALGYGNKATANYSIAMGSLTEAKGWFSTAIGYQTKASADYTTAMGYLTIASGINSTAMGRNAIASGSYSTAMGYGTEAKGYQLVLGRYNTISGVNSWLPTDPLLIVGNGTSSSNRSNAFTLLKNGKLGLGTAAPLTALHIEGGGLFINGDIGATPVEGSGSRLMWIPEKKAFRAGAVNGNQWNADSIGNYSVAFGTNTIASNHGAFASGTANKATGNSSTALGAYSTAAGTYSTSLGGYNQASGYGATTIGMNSIASGFYATTIGQNNQALGNASLAVGEEAQANGNRAIALGNHVIANAFQVVMGRYNDPAGDPNSWRTNDPLVLIGNGQDDANRSNAFTLLKNGNLGLGINNPTERLHIKGKARIDSLLFANQGIQFADGSILNTATNSDTTIFDYLTVNKRLKIGQNSLYLGSDSLGANNHLWTDNGPLTLNGDSTGGNQDTYINPVDGKVGIGTTVNDPVYGLPAANTLYKTVIKKSLLLTGNNSVIGFKADSTTNYHGDNAMCLEVRPNGHPHFPSCTNPIRGLNFFRPFATSQDRYNGNFDLFISSLGGSEGFVGIGTPYPKYRLSVNGTLGARKVIVEAADWCDYVFEKDYYLMPLNDVEIYIQNNKHLPEIPSETEVIKNGQNLAEINKLLLKKVEELTLYIIDIEKRLQKVEH